MHWLIKTPDPYRWHYRFAVFPKRIGNCRVWFERYAWREIIPPSNAVVSANFQTREWREYCTRGGYGAILELTYYLSSMFGPSKRWVEELREVA